MYNKIYLIGLLFSLACITDISGQLSRREFSVGAEYFVPIDRYRWIFEKTPVYKASLMWGKKPKGKVANWFGLTASYMKHSAVEDTLFYLVSNSEYGFYVYEDRTVIQIAAKYRWETVGDALGFYWGTEVGYLIDKYDYYHDYPGVNSYYYLNTQGGLVAPYLGMRYSNIEGFGGFIQARYEFSFANDIMNAMSFGGGLSYRF